jgi:hypothetical protein
VLLILGIAWSCYLSIKQNVGHGVLGFFIGLGRMTVAPVLGALVLAAYGNLQQALDKKAKAEKEAKSKKAELEAAKKSGKLTANEQALLSSLESMLSGKGKKGKGGTEAMIAGLLLAAAMSFCVWVVWRLVKVRKWK